MAILNSAFSGGASGEVYSTEETRIGTWIDGKPLYRKIITDVSPGKNSSKYYFISSDSIDIVSMYGAAQVANGNYSTIDSLRINNVTCSTSYMTGGTVLLMATGDSYYNFNFFMFFEYTKTTD